MTLTEQRLMYQSIVRIHRLWFEETQELEPLAKIDALFEVLHMISPFRCCERVGNMWAAYRYARVEHLPKLALYRLNLFSDAIEGLKALAEKLPAEVKGMNS